MFGLLGVEAAGKLGIMPGGSMELKTGLLVAGVKLPVELMFSASSVEDEDEEDEDEEDEEDEDEDNDDEEESTVTFGWCKALEPSCASSGISAGMSAVDTTERSSVSP